MTVSIELEQPKSAIAVFFPPTKYSLKTIVTAIILLGKRLKMVMVFNCTGVLNGPVGLLHTNCS